MPGTIAGGYDGIAIVVGHAAAIGQMPVFARYIRLGKTASLLLPLLSCQYLPL